MRRECHGATTPRRIRGAAAILVAAALVAWPAAAQERRTGPRVVRLVSGGETIPVVLTARGVTTMLSLPEEAREAVCGDLYDPQTSSGGYVVQRSGRDLFLKPLRAAGVSNLFVKTERATYAFELEVVAPERAMRIVRVALAPEARPERALEAAFERPVAIGRGVYLRCELRNAGREPIAVAAAEISGGDGARVPIDARIDPGRAAAVVLSFGRLPDPDTTVRFVDPAGAALLAAQPFRQP
jgi:hypothetical protein